MQRGHPAIRVIKPRMLGKALLQQGAVVGRRIAKHRVIAGQLRVAGVEGTKTPRRAFEVDQDDDFLVVRQLRVVRR